jgi:hypothetical protein
MSFSHPAPTKSPEALKDQSETDMLKRVNRRRFLVKGNTVYLFVYKLEIHPEMIDLYEPMLLKASKVANNYTDNAINEVVVIVSALIPSILATLLIAFSVISFLPALALAVGLFTLLSILVDRIHRVTHYGLPLRLFTGASHVRVKVIDHNGEYVNNNEAGLAENENDVRTLIRIAKRNNT